VKFRKTLSFAAIFFLLIIATTNSSTAATKVVPKPIKVVAAKPNFITNLSSAPGDQISAIITAPKMVAYVGTMESSTVAPYTAPQIGGTDGFIAAIDATGVPIWDLRLGTTQDDIATAVARDLDGNFWVVGVSAKPPVSQPTPTPEPSANQPINVDGVSVDPVTTPTSTLGQMVVWKVSSSGVITATYTYDTYGVILPSDISYLQGKFLVTGFVGSLISQQGFKVELDATGNFSKFVSNKTSLTPNNKVVTIKAGLGTIKYFPATKVIAGIKSWKPKTALPAIVRYSHSGAITAAYSLPGKILSVSWRVGIGFVALSEIGNNYGITIIDGVA